MTEKTQETALVQAAQTALSVPDYGIDVQRVLVMRKAVEEVIAKVLHEGEHYGVIPGTDTRKDGKGNPLPPKKALLQPGAEVLCMVFRMRPEPIEVAVIERDDFIFIKIRCKLYNSVTGELLGEAIGSANTREDKYVKQTAARLCPKCEKPTIFKSKRPPYGWFCWAEKGGCGAQFTEEDKQIIDQTGSLNSNKVWGLHHTILSMAQKRAYVKAVRNATGTSDIFTDEEAAAAEDDDAPTGHGTSQAPRTSAPKPAATAPKAGVTDVQKLTAVLDALQIGTGVDPALPPDQQKAQTKRARLAWINGHLQEANEEPVASSLELTPPQVGWLLSKANAGTNPSGW
jgi:hypothetical protein